MHENKTIIRSDNLCDDLLPCDTHLKGYTVSHLETACHW